MAKVTMNLPLTNALGDFSLYQMEGVPKLIIRAKGGPTKDQIANEPQFERLRNSQSEFSGAGKAIGMIMDTTRGLNHLADHAFGGMLTKICRLIQTKDTVADPGKRPILFSKYGKMLEGMNFNDRKPIDSVLKHLPDFTISRDEHKATVYFTELFPGVNLLNPWNHPLYRLLVSFGVLQDMVLTKRGYEVTNRGIIMNKAHVITDWHSSNTPLAASILELTLPNNTILDANSSLVLSVGIEFGRMISNSVSERVKKAGCGKIIGIG